MAQCTSHGASPYHYLPTALDMLTLYQVYRNKKYIEILVKGGQNIIKKPAYNTQTSKIIQKMYTKQVCQQKKKKYATLHELKTLSEMQEKVKNIVRL